MVIARNRALAVHHVTVHAIGGRLSISLDLEVDGSLSLGAAHEIADGLEAALRAELGAEVEVETHIEPLQMRGLSGRDAPTERVAAVRDALTAIAANIAFVGQMHDVRVRETADGEIVNFHCRVDPTLTVQRRAREGRRRRARAAAEIPDHQAGDRPRRAACVKDVLTAARLKSAPPDPIG